MCDAFGHMATGYLQIKFCATAQFDLRATLSTDNLFYRMADSETFRSDCAYTQADLVLHCLHLFKGLFLHGSSHMMNDN